MLPTHLKLRASLLLLACLTPVLSLAQLATQTPAVSQTAAPAKSSDNDQANPLPLWEIGAFGIAVSQQAYPGSSERVNRGLALPVFVYRGEYLRADRGGAGLRAIKTPTFEVDIGFAGAFGSRSDSSEARRGMPELGTLVQFGPRLKWNLGKGPGNGLLRAELPLRGVFDISDHFAQKGAALEPELIFERQAKAGWNYSTSIGVVLGDQKLNQTFYGVAPLNATALRPAYTATGGLTTWRLAASMSHALTNDLRIFGFTRLDNVSGSANASSPLIKSKNGVSFGLGVIYSWKQSERMAAN